MPLIFTPPPGNVLTLDSIVPVGDPSLCWALDAPNGASDLSGNAKDGTAGGGIGLGDLTDAPPGWNGSTDFDGSADRITTAYNPFVNGVARTFMGWAYRDADTNTDPLFGGNVATVFPYLRLVGSLDNLDFQVDASTGTKTTWANAWPGNAQWVHWGLVFDEAADEASLYINGGLVSTETQTGTYNASPGNLVVGRNGTTATAANFFDGRMAMFQVFERALTAGEIGADYERGAAALHKRVELDLSSWVDKEGINWGDAAIEQYMAEQKIGSMPVDGRAPNRQITVPLILRDRDEGTFEEIRTSLLQKVGLLQSEGGTIRRGGVNEPLFADVMNATLALPDSWMQEQHSIEPDAVLTLEALPDFYGHEVAGEEEASSATAGETIVTVSNATGDTSARMRALIRNASSDPQRGMLYAIRSRFRGDDTDAMSYEAEDLDPQGGAAVATLSGASGGATNNVVSHTSLPVASWISILQGSFNHVGPHRVWARIYDPGSEAGLVKLRLEWFTGDATRPTQNAIVYTPLIDNFAIVDLGEVLPRQARVGSQNWIGRILARAEEDNSGADISIDKLWVLPTAEPYGTARIAAPSQTPTNISALDEFNQVVTGGSDPLNGLTASTGGAWDTDDLTTGADFVVEDTNHTCQRTAVSDTNLATGRYALLGSSVASCSVQVDLGFSAHVLNLYPGVLARYVDTSNWLQAVVFQTTANTGSVVVYKRVGGTQTPIGQTAFSPFFGIVDATYRLALTVDTAGVWSVDLEINGSSAGTVLSGQDADLATGGTLASGKAGIYDAQTSATANTRTYDNFIVSVPDDPDAILYPSRLAELRTDGLYRESEDGTAFPPVVLFGDLPRLPLSGIEARDIEVLIKTSEGDLDSLPDAGLDAPAVRVLSRPAWLFPPRS